MPQSTEFKDQPAVTVPRHVQFVSMMSGVPWGGSEELWAAAAEKLLDRGIRVSILSKKWDVIPQKIAALVSRGATLRRYDEGFGFRFRSALIRRGLRAFGPFKLLVDADVTIASLGSFPDARWYLPITDEILNDGHDFVAVVQAAPQNPEKLSDIDKQFLFNFYSSANKTFFVAEHNRKTSEESLGRSLHSTEIVNNPVNLTNLEIKPFKESETLKLACVGRLHFFAKGQDVLVRALGRGWRDRDFELLFFGAGPDETRLNEMIREAGLEGKVRIVGFSNDVDKIFADAHALVLPSQFEGTPLVCVEAALSGRAAMVTDVGDSKRCFLEGVSGFIAKECSEDAIANAMERLWQARGRLKEMGRIAHEDAKINFSEDGADKLLRAIGVEI